MTNEIIELNSQLTKPPFTVKRPNRLVRSTFSSIWHQEIDQPPIDKTIQIMKAARLAVSSPMEPHQCLCAVSSMRRTNKSFLC